MGLYELTETESPDYAVLSQAVEAARLQGGEGGARLANAVLRKLSGRRDRDAGFPDWTRDPLGYLTTWGSHPSWLIERWLARWDASDVRRLVETNNRVPTVYVRARDGDAERLSQALARAGRTYGSEVAGTGCLPLNETEDLVDLLPRIDAFVQDPAGALVAKVVAPSPGDTVVDLCAAPGGKARALAAAGARVIAGDASEVRVRLMRDGPGGADIPAFVADARHPAVHPVSTILVDAPCTGTGTLGRHPDGRWRLSVQALEDLVALQREILDAAGGVVTPGGLLVYATCSLEPEENQDQIVQFLARHPDFSLERASGVDEAWLDPRGNLEVLPHKTGFDGAFAARLRRSS